MGLKIVSGSAKGHKLKGPKKAAIRPAAARVRKSVFDILGDLSGQKVLDLFAGTGSMGIEALSRGAREGTFVDSNSKAIALLYHNLEKTGFLDRARVVKKRVELALEVFHRNKFSFDLIFLDPPYDKGMIQRCMKKLSDYEILSPNGILLSEHSPRERPPFLSGLEKIDERQYGQTIVSFFKKK